MVLSFSRTVLLYSLSNFALGSSVVKVDHSRTLMESVKAKFSYSKQRVELGTTQVNILTTYLLIRLINDTILLQNGITTQ